jgi:hypothetical protein
VVISGDGALLGTHATGETRSEIDDVISKLVVNRGEEPLPPGERLVLQSPHRKRDELPLMNQSDSNGNFNFGGFHIQL